MTTKKVIFFGLVGYAAYRWWKAPSATEKDLARVGADAVASAAVAPAAAGFAPPVAAAALSALNQIGSSREVDAHAAANGGCNDEGCEG